jgi:hypothetical protein
MEKLNNIWEIDEKKKSGICGFYIRTPLLWGACFEADEDYLLNEWKLKKKKVNKKRRTETLEDVLEGRVCVSGLMKTPNVPILSLEKDEKKETKLTIKENNRNEIEEKKEIINKDFGIIKETDILNMNIFSDCINICSDSSVVYNYSDFIKADGCIVKSIKTEPTNLLEGFSLSSLSNELVSPLCETLGFWNHSSYFTCETIFLSLLEKKRNEVNNKNASDYFISHPLFIKITKVFLFVFLF